MMDRRKRGEESAWAEGGREADAPQVHEETARQEQDPASEPHADAEAQQDAAGEGPEEAVVRLEAEKADLTDRLLRLAADMDNLRKRSERDVSEAGRYAIARFAGDMLTIADNLRRALEAVPAELRQGEAAPLVEGVEMTAREFDRLMAKHGVERIAAEGDRFDPHRHQAMFEVPDPSARPGTIVQVVQDGYMIGDRVLRAAMVGVAKAAPGQRSGEGETVDGEEPPRATGSG